MTYRQIRRTDLKRQLDRSQWAQPIEVVTSYEVFGSGAIVTEAIDFGTVFQNPPFFAYGVEMVEGEVPNEDDLPFVTCGVTEWVTTERDIDTRAALYYLGARIWINVSAAYQYRLLFRLSFEGMAMRNVEHFREG